MATRGRSIESETSCARVRTSLTGVSSSRDAITRWRLAAAAAGSAVERETTDIGPAVKPCESGR